MSGSHSRSYIRRWMHQPQHRAATNTFMGDVVLGMLVSGSCALILLGVLGVLSLRHSV